MMKKLAFVAAVLVSTGVMAGPKPFNLSITPDIAVHDRSQTIEGVTLSVWGENEQTSLALGVVNGTVGDSAGLSWGLFLNYADDYRGIQWAPINYTKGRFLGWQQGIVNYSGAEMEGLQTGMVNYAGRLRGVQFGFVNYAETAETGVQIGLANILPENREWFTGLPEELAPAMVFVNWHF